jgi:hypothetical protein
MRSIGKGGPAECCEHQTGPIQPQKRTLKMDTIILRAPVRAAQDQASPAGTTQWLPPRSLNAAREAAWEMDALLEMMLDRVGPGVAFATPEEKAEALRTRGVLLRMHALTSVLMSAVTDDATDPEPLERKVFGRVLTAVDHD